VDRGKKLFRARAGPFVSSRRPAPFATASSLKEIEIEISMKYKKLYANKM